ncbi:hypothetical protein Spb1_18410 [Planctopirus ephydatiae]|uniref:Uncharacterized protein n=1 Tax=Planctopirus ephydatiae TaxID=2528019 RepID=A0A518GN97_9PLAN|nr:hypothetical protein Spb1_18410 [Planctopirus ephydatiae]
MNGVVFTLQGVSHLIQVESIEHNRPHTTGCQRLLVEAEPCEIESTMLLSSRFHMVQGIK